MKKSTFKFLAIAMFFLMGTAVMAQTQYSATFNVDMTGVEGFDAATEQIFIAGSFPDWAEPGSDAAYLMSPTEEDPMFYTITLTVDSGQVMYKYFKVMVDSTSWAGGEWTGVDNRVVQLSEDVTFFNTWANRPHNITFNVDMTGVDPFDAATDDVYITGTVTYGHDWMQPGMISAYMMSPTEDGSMIYTIVMSLYQGENAYKYFRVINNEASWDNGEPVASDRMVMLDTVAATIDNVWGDISGIFNEPNVFTYSMYPNPVVTVLNIDNTSDVTSVKVFDITGKLVRTTDVVFAQNVTIDVAELQAGVYVVNVTNNKGTQTSKFIKN